MKADVFHLSQSLSFKQMTTVSQLVGDLWEGDTLQVMPAEQPAVGSAPCHGAAQRATVSECTWAAGDDRGQRTRAGTSEPECYIGALRHISNVPMHHLPHHKTGQTAGAGPRGNWRGTEHRRVTPTTVTHSQDQKPLLRQSLVSKKVLRLRKDVTGRRSYKTNAGLPKQQK